MHLDQNFIFLVIIAIVGITRAISHLATKARASANAEKRKAALPATRPTAIEPQTNDAERIKKFLDALGHPDVLPPPRVKPRIDLPPHPLAPIAPPMAPFSPRRQAKPLTWPAKKTPVIAPADVAAPTTPVEEDPAYRVQPLETPPSAVPAAPVTLTPTAAAAAPTRRSDSPLLNLLRSPAGLQNAVLLREIFGPPRGLQLPEAIGF